MENKKEEVEMTTRKSDKIMDEVKSCAIEVYETPGAGYEERIYQEAMAVEFRKRKIHYEVERLKYSIREKKLAYIGLTLS